MFKIWQILLMLFRDERAAVELDPFQMIVNVQWSGLAVEFGDHAEDAPKPAEE